MIQRPFIPFIFYVTNIAKLCKKMNKKKLIFLSINFNKGATRLCVSSDRGTIHVFILDTPEKNSRSSYNFNFSQLYFVIISIGWISFFVFNYVKKTTFQISPWKKKTSRQKCLLNLILRILNQVWLENKRLFWLL